MELESSDRSLDTLLFKQWIRCVQYHKTIVSGSFDYGTTTVFKI